MSSNTPAPWWKEIVQPFVDLVKAPRALWGINLGFMLEGMVYFGILGYLTMYFADFVFQGVENPNDRAHSMVMVLTAGITLSMLFLGKVADKKGIRFALITAFILMIIGRVIISAAPTILGLEPAGLWSPLHLVTMGGILFIVVGYGMYQPGAYSAVKKFTTPKTAGIAFAMLYALMNLGGWLPSFAFLVRDDEFLGLGIPGTFWVYTGITVLALAATVLLLTRGTVKKALEDAARKTAAEKAADAAANPTKEAPIAQAPQAQPVGMWEKFVSYLKKHPRRPQIRLFYLLSHSCSDTLHI